MSEGVQRLKLLRKSRTEDMRTIRAIVLSLRPLQWVKNLFVFAGLVFSQEFLNPQKFLLSLETFVVFCFLASGIYLFNDIVDLPADRLHPDKKHRPLPSGEIPIYLAGIISVLLVFIGLFWSAKLSSGLFLIGAMYVVLQILYTFILKKLVIVDIIVVASGFLLRAAAGAVVLGVEISSWLLLCTSLLALFMVTAKRRQELFRIETEKTPATRKVMREYSLPFLDEILAIQGYGAIITYAIYVFDPGTASRFGTKYLGLTLPFVIYGIFRYLFLVKVEGRGESPERLVISDPIFIINLLLWMASVLIIIYY